MTGDDADINGVLPGLKLANEVVTPAEEARLISLIESCKPRNYEGDEQGGLRAISFGWNYDLASSSFAPSGHIPEGFAAIRESAARFAGVDPQDIVQVLLNRYEAGADIPYHCDKSIWRDIVGVSLGSETSMHFRKPLAGSYQYGEARLRRRSMYLMSGEVRELFEHSIPAVRDRRWSITLRTFSAEGRKLSASFG